MIDQSKLPRMMDWYGPSEMKPVEDPIIEGKLRVRWGWFASDVLDRIRAELSFLSIAYTYEMFGKRTAVFTVKGKKSDIDKLTRWVDEKLRGEL